MTGKSFRGKRKGQLRDSIFLEKNEEGMHDEDGTSFKKSGVVKRHQTGKPVREEEKNRYKTPPNFSITSAKDQGNEKKKGREGKMIWEGSARG